MILNNAYICWVLNSLISGAVAMRFEVVWLQQGVTLLKAAA